MRLIAEDCIRVGDKLFLFCRHYNLFFSIDLNNSQIVLEGSIPGYDFINFQLCRKMISYNDKIVFIPYNMSDVYVYEMHTKKWERVSICTDRFHKKGGMFLQAVPDGDLIFLFGGNYSYIVKINLISYEVTYIDALVDAIDVIRDAKDVMFRGQYVRHDDICLFPSGLSNRLLKFNLKTMESTWISVGQDSDIFSGIIWDGQSYWLSPRKTGDVIKWNGKDVLKRYPLPEGFDPKCSYFSGIYLNEDKIFLPAMGQDKSVVICDENVYIEKMSYSFAKREDGDYYKFRLDGVIEVHYENEVKFIICDVGNSTLTDFLVATGIEVHMDDKEMTEDYELPLIIFCRLVCTGE